MFPDIQGRGESPALSCPRLPPPRSILRMGTKKNRNTAKKQSVSAASGPRRKDSSVLGASLSCTVPLGHGSHLQDSWLDLLPDSGCPILLQRVSCPLSVLHSHCTDWRGACALGIEKSFRGLRFCKGSNHMVNPSMASSVKLQCPSRKISEILSEPLCYPNSKRHSGGKKTCHPS